MAQVAFYRNQRDGSVYIQHFREITSENFIPFPAAGYIQLSRRVLYLYGFVSGLREPSNLIP